MSDFLYQCSVCDRQTVSTKAAEIDDCACCMPCALDHNRPGKFQQYSCSDLAHFDAEAMGKCLLLYQFSLDSSEDDFMSNEGWGYCGRFDKYLLFIDTSGFVHFEEFDSAEKAEKKYDEYYSDGWGASEDDIYVSCDRGRWEAWESGKQIPCHARNVRLDYDDVRGIDRRRVLAAVSVHMRKTGYYPNIWETSERGSMREISAEVW